MNKRIEQSFHREDDGKTRRNTRSVSPMPPRQLDNELISPTAKKQRTSPRFLFETCCDINGLESKLKCSGCHHCDDFGTKPRKEHTSYKYKCYKAWERDAKTVKKRMLPHYNGIMAYVNHHMGIDPSSLKKRNNNNNHSHIRHHKQQQLPCQPHRRLK